MLCENCNSDHDGTLGSGRFCSVKCQKGFSTKSKRKEINEKVSRSLKGRSFEYMTENGRKAIPFLKPLKPGHNVRPPKKSLDDILSNRVPYNTTDLKFRLFQEGLKDQRCEQCSLTEWLGQPAPLDLDHIDGNPKNNNFENLRILCPNCHRQTPTWGRKNRANLIQR